VIGPDAFLEARADQLAALALRHAFPTIYIGNEFAAAGGLMSYGSSLRDAYAIPPGTGTGVSADGPPPECWQEGHAGFSAVAESFGARGGSSRFLISCSHVKVVRRLLVISFIKHTPSALQAVRCR
jgi:hypothetical protein